MNFNELREKYEFISYESFDYIRSDKEIEVTFTYVLGEYTFNHKLIIPIKSFFDMENEKYKDIFLFNLGLIELINYYKLACPKKVLLKCGAIDKKQEEFWKKLYYNGLGEFRYINKIDVLEDDFVNFINRTSTVFSKTKKKDFSGNIIPVGGGKDSIVTLELLKDKFNENTPFIINPRGATIDTVNVAGYSMDSTIEVYRKLDGKLIELNKEGFLNGHIPFSAMLAFLSIFCALLTNKKFVVLSNESSADESTDAVTGANHQYSKSLEFEKDFVSYVEKYVNSEIKYFSLLRGFRELDIAKMFAEHKKYHKIFRSCNVGSKNGENRWCGKCPKCLFVYIMLAPFLEEKELIEIFGSNLLDDIELNKYYRELTGLDPVKPFECVGTRDEVNEAVQLIKEKYKDKKMPALLNIE